MTGQQRDFEEVLSRVLHTTTDRVEPVGDGLTKIRGRLAEPWLKRQWWLLCSEFMTLRWLVVVRSESLLSTIRSRSAAADLTAAGSAARATTGASRRRGSVPVLGGILAWASSKGGARRSPGPVMNWLRPALAVAGAVVLVVAGVFALGQIREGIVSLSNGSGAIAPGSTSQSGPNGGPNGSGSKSSAGSQTSSATGKPSKRGVSSHVGATSSPSPCASPSPSAQQPSPSSSPPSSPTPSPSSSPTSSPTTSPTPTTSPSPTGSNGPVGFQSPPPVGGYASSDSHARTTALTCVQGPGPSPTSAASPA